MAEELETKKVLSSVSRRNFLKMGALASAGLTMSATTIGCSNTLAETGEAPVAEDEFEEETGEWRFGTCQWNCGSRCVNYALVQDGMVVRQKADDRHEHTGDYPQLRGCVRGRSTRRLMYNPDRLKYPMKRKNWMPGGGENTNGHLRGIDEWERISWDEAFELLATEIKRIYADYGPASVLSCADPTHLRCLTAMGGNCNWWGTQSFGTWLMTPHCIGYYPIPVDFNMSHAAITHADTLGMWMINDRIDLRNCETVILWGQNPAWSSHNGMKNWTDIRQHGARFIIVDPYYNDTGLALGAEWYPVRPGTDVPLMLGMIYNLLEEDDPAANPLIDWECVEKCTVGFDAEHPTPGLDPSQNLKDYVLGVTDGVPKTPEWASELCGLEPERIRALSRELAKDKKVALVSSYGPARQRNGESFPHLFISLGAITGHFGKSGHTTGVSCSWRGGGGGPLLASEGTDGMPSVAECLGSGTNEGTDIDVSWLTTSNEGVPNIALEGIWDAILNKKTYDTGCYQGLPGKEIPLDLRLMWFIHANWIQTTGEIEKAIAAMRTLDCVVVNEFWFTSTAQYADLVFPAALAWESPFKVNGSLNDRELNCLTTKLVEPGYEIRTEKQIDEGVLAALGFDPAQIYPISDDQRIFNIVKGTTVVGADGVTPEPLVTITQEDIDKMGVEGEPQEGKVDFQSWLKEGVYQVSRTEGDNYGYIAFEDFRRDPEANPLPSASGKIEIASKTLADKINAIGYSTIEPYPTYIEQVEGYKDSFTDWDNKVKGELPLQAISLHYPRRVHTVFDSVRQLQEAWTNPVFVNASDARERGVKEGDTVMVQSRIGKVLRHACPTERLMPGVVMLPHGPRMDFDDETKIDSGGNESTITSFLPTGQGTNGYNTILVDFQIFDGAPIPADMDKPYTIIFEEE